MFKQIIIFVVTMFIISFFSCSHAAIPVLEDRENEISILDENTDMIFFTSKDVKEMAESDEVIGFMIHDLINNNNTVNGTVVAKDHKNDPLWQDVDKYMLSFNGMYWVCSNTNKNGITTYTLFSTSAYDIISNASGIARTAEVVDGQIVYK